MERQRERAPKRSTALTEVVCCVSANMEPSVMRRSRRWWTTLMTTVGRRCYGRCRRRSNPDLPTKSKTPSRDDTSSLGLGHLAATVRACVCVVCVCVCMGMRVCVCVCVDLQCLPGCRWQCVEKSDLEDWIHIRGMTSASLQIWMKSVSHHIDEFWFMSCGEQCSTSNRWKVFHTHKKSAFLFWSYIPL